MKRGFSSKGGRRSDVETEPALSRSPLSMDEVLDRGAPIDPFPSWEGRDGGTVVISDGKWRVKITLPKPHEE